MDCFARFHIGDKERPARGLFRKLMGSRELSEKDLLLMELMEISNDLPLSIDMISCTLEQIGENAKMITKELFTSKILSVTN